MGQTLGSGREHGIAILRGKAELIEVVCDVQEFLVTCKENFWDGGDVHALVAGMRRKLETPFKLGVVGQFRSGKSSLVNALVGDRVALVDEVEATPALTRYYWAPHPTAAIVFRDGRREMMEIQDAISLSSERRRDHEWLSEIERFEFGYPTTMLQQVEFWDTPGLGGSEFNRRTAESFVREVNAAVWVFDADSIGRADIAEALEGLSTRGKRIVAVVNKAEALDKADFERATDLVQRLYPKVIFVEVLPFSARVVLGQAGLDKPRKLFGDALEEDGGIEGMFGALERLILSDADSLTTASGARELLAILGSFEDRLGAQELNLRNRVERYSRLGKDVDSALEKHFSALDERLTIGAINYVRKELQSRCESEIEKGSTFDLQGRGFLGSILTRTFDHDAAIGLLEEYRRLETPAIAGAIQGLGLEIEDLLVGLPAPERAILMRAGRAVFSQLCIEPANLPDWNWQELLANYERPEFPIDVEAPLDEFRLSSRLRVETTALSNRVIATKIEVLSEMVLPMIREQLGLSRSRIAEAMEARLREVFLLGGLPEVERKRLIEMGVVRTTVESLILRLGDVEQVVPMQAIGPLREPTTFLPDERDRIRELWATLGSVNTADVAILDGSLSSRDLLEFLSFPVNVPLRVITWNDPLSLPTTEAFSEGVQEVRNFRHGAVSVIVPDALDETHASRLPSGSWIFLGGRAYQLSCSIGQALSGKVAFEFTPVSDENARYEMFDQWWYQEVSGFRYVAL
jgi:GTPase SAR1 family protein